MLNLQQWSPPIENPEWNYAKQMLEQFNQTGGGVRFSGETVESVTRLVGETETKAYCMNVTASSMGIEKKMRWETYKILKGITETFVIISYPADATDEVIASIAQILESIEIK